VIQFLRALYLYQANILSLGTSPAAVGTPDEEVGYIASDEYMHRMASPGPESRFDSQPVVESPLRKMSFPASETQPKSPNHHRTSSHGLSEGVIHIDDPMHPLHHPDGFYPTRASEDHTPEADEPAEEEEPILAADEMRPESAYLHPAVSPTFEHRGSFDEDTHSRTPSISHSRSNSRSASAGGAPMLTRFDSREMHDDSHRPLEDVEEYEPLFPEDDSKKERPISAADRFKMRPDMLKHRFPSQDIWEDTPNSLQHYATVTTPDLPKRDSSEAFETPEQEAVRKMQTAKIDSHNVASHILEGEGARGKEKPTRPDFKQRFPSRDIWEDAPDSQQLVTTVEPAADEVKSPEATSKPSIPPRPQKQTQATSPTEKRQPPGIPDRPKPQIPARPMKPSSQASAEDAAVTKAKPAIPARPGGSKIAALKAGFLTDLNSRLQLGPQQPKPQEKEPEPAAEKQPLSDARKGRARGPARRKPAAENANARLPTIPEIKITTAWNVWSVGEDGDLTVGNDASPGKTESTIPSELPAAPELAKNMAGEPVDPAPEPPAAAEVLSPNTVEPNVDPIPTENPETPEPTETSVVAAELASPKDEPKKSPSGATALAEGVPSSTKLDEALEDMTASADGKRMSDGDIHATES